MKKGEGEEGGYGKARRHPGEDGGKRVEKVGEEVQKGEGEVMGEYLLLPIHTAAAAQR